MIYLLMQGSECEGSTPLSAHATEALALAALADFLKTEKAYGCKYAQSEDYPSTNHMWKYYTNLVYIFPIEVQGL